jgi:hypothetical protein
MGYPAPEDPGVNGRSQAKSVICLEEPVARLADHLLIEISHRRTAEVDIEGRRLTLGCGNAPDHSPEQRTEN